MAAYFWYALFAVTTALVGLIDLCVPALRAISDRNLNMVKYGKITLVTFFVLFLAMAPVVFLVYIRPSYSIRFRDRLIEVMSEQ